ncbi:group III truncated hemoglobin [Sphingobacterium oryzagri]|uniref:Group III truncated hemoglobin n=1 Tax=Sphingobacterium oryzagri TaxID=3025669 RepID=A0ABY7WKL9_9SPHI|nr:group III truncated hemoglobin [Sphingobacterium sp. KACC 22765]WDF69698.1 group III truncated hemoglobin [Sphingobacterium sp. KACC 22765]
MEKKDIQTLDDIKLLVNTFYGKVQQDELIGPIFQEKIQDRWPAHLEKMYTFWQTMLLDQHTYTGRPFPPHAQLAITATHFERWLTIFHDTIADLFEGPLAVEAAARGSKMAALFQIKLDHIRQSPFRPLL